MGSFCRAANQSGGVGQRSGTLAPWSAFAANVMPYLTRDRRRTGARRAAERLSSGKSCRRNQRTLRMWITAASFCPGVIRWAASSPLNRSFVAERLCRQNTRSGGRRIERRQQRDSNRHCGDNQAIQRPGRKGQRVERVDLSREMDEVVVPAGP